jgi:hypothetical protein
MTRMNPMVRTAARLHEVVVARFERRSTQLANTAQFVLERASSLRRSLSMLSKARARGWHAAANRVYPEVSDALRHLQYAVNDAPAQPPHRRASMPPFTFRDAYEELMQLEREFAGVNVDVKDDTISAVTEPVELEGIYLGPFRIVLSLWRLAESRGDVSVFDVVALDPRPAVSSDGVTHPHVRDEQLCPGDATGPIMHALAEGRLSDAFMSIRSVLNTYNPASPYVRLEDWTGTACADCGHVVGEDDRYYCEECGDDYCGECYVGCDVCDRSSCRGCLEEDPDSGQRCCRSCRRRCDRCGRLVSADHFVEEVRLCPECDELRERELLQEQQTTDTEENDDDDGNREQSDVIGSGGDDVRDDEGRAAQSEPAVNAPATAPA